MVRPQGPEGAAEAGVRPRARLPRSCAGPRLIVAKSEHERRERRSTPAVSTRSRIVVRPNGFPAPSLRSGRRAARAIGSSRDAARLNVGRWSTRRASTCCSRRCRGLPDAHVALVGFDDGDGTRAELERRERGSGRATASHLVPPFDGPAARALRRGGRVRPPVAATRASGWSRPRRPPPACRRRHRPVRRSRSCSRDRAGARRSGRGGRDPRRRSSGCSADRSSCVRGSARAAAPSPRSTPGTPSSSSRRRFYRRALGA